MNFWDKLFSKKKMVLGLSPMDGVTDVAMRYMTAKYSTHEETPPTFGVPTLPSATSPVEESPHGGVDLLFTEFVSVDALHYAQGERRERLLKTFLRARDVNLHSRSVGVLHSGSDGGSPFEIAQVFGSKPELFAEAAVLIEKLGFDGIDINMGCPAHKVEENGSGAGLIRTPALAQEIIRTVKLSTKLPVSVKTRIGVVDKSEMEEWIHTLMEMKLVNITLHGRTLRQLYQGSADWETIGRAAEIVHKYGGHILGNGDIESVASAKFKVESYGVDGVLIGRSAEGNPGIFVGVNEPSKEQRLDWMLEHAKIYEQIFDNFMPMRKHLAWYCKGFEGAVEMRTKLMMTNNADEVEKVIESSRV